MAELEVIGAEDLIKKLKRNANLDDVRNVVKVNTSEMHRQAQKFSPVDTGFLKRSILQGMYDGGFTGNVRATANYASYVEYGTRNWPYGMPFIRPSFHMQKEKFKRDLDRLMK